MLTNSKIALSVALVLATASAACGSQAHGSPSDDDRAASACRHLPELRLGAPHEFSD